MTTTELVLFSLCIVGIAVGLCRIRRSPCPAGGSPEHTKRSTPDPVTLIAARQSARIQQLELKLAYTERELEAAYAIIRARPHTSTIRIALMSPGGDA